jgi:hypothetical protein
LRVTGVQHPAPTLICSILRGPVGFEVSAPFAKPVLNTVSVQPVPPLSEMWFLLYAQVHQADDADRRNLLLSRRQGLAIRQKWRFAGQGERALSGTATWSQEEIVRILGDYLLDPHTARDRAEPRSARRRPGLRAVPAHLAADALASAVLNGRPNAQTGAEGPSVRKRTLAYCTQCCGWA